MVLPALTSFLALLSALNFWGWHENYLGLTLGIIWLLLTSWLLGKRAGPLSKSISARFIWGLIIVACSISVFGSVLFYINLFTPTAVISLAALLPWFGNYKKTDPILSAEQFFGFSHSVTLWFTVIFYLIITVVIFLLLNSVTLTDAIRTPWTVIPPAIFLLITIAAGSTLIVARHKVSPLWLVPFYLVFLTLLIIIYPLGYGFDPFIHQASEKLLAATGTISPKPLYYIGQYTLVTFLAQMLALPIKTIDLWLLPLLASLILPVSACSFISQLKISEHWHLPLALTPLLFGLSYFTYTTPQGLAYLWVITTIFVIAAHKLGARIPAKIPWLISLAAGFTHPLAGLPLVGVVTLWWLQEYGSRLKNIRYWRLTATFTTALVVPVTFALLSWLKPSAASIKFTPNISDNLTRLLNDISYHLPFLPRFVDLPDIIYLWARPSTLTFVVLAIIGFFLARRYYKPLRFIGGVALLPTAGYLILALLFVFPNLPANEQSFYSLRLWEITQLILFPLVILGAYWLINLTTKRLQHTSSWIVIGSLLLTTSFYLTYPRFDIWHRDTAYNTTYQDILTVQLIDQLAEGAQYVVLANQAIAAAAINEFGFNNYYNGFFYYPVPTGINPLYQVYLNAVERGLPTRQIIKEAAQTGVPQVFLVLNSYWADYSNLKQVAAKEADAWWEVANGKISVYRYDF